VIDRGNLAGPPNPWQPARNGMRHLPEVVAWNRAVFDAVATGARAGPRAAADGRRPLPGDRLDQRRGPPLPRSSGKNLRVIWLDAHTDVNTEAISPSGNMHGMPVACLLGHGRRNWSAGAANAPPSMPEQIDFIGIRSVDADEKQAIRQLGLQVFDMRHIDEHGMRNTMTEVLQDVDEDTHMHVSFDLDCLDPLEAPGVGTGVRGGPTYREMQLCMEMIADTGRLGSLDVVEINPALDVRNRTAELAVEFIQSLFGASTLARSTPGASPGIDTILRGGLTRDRLYLLEGMPGSGKTTIAMQFLTEGVAQGEKVLYVTLSETTERAARLRAVARLDARRHRHPRGAAVGKRARPGRAVHDLPSDRGRARPHHAADRRGGRGRVKPSRLVIDSLSELQLLAANSLRYRRQVLAFKQFFSTRACTVLLLDDRSTANGDLEVRSIAHGVLSLNQLNTDFGGTRRRMQVIKYRGVPFIEGMHDYLIRHGGVVVFPRLVASSGRIIAHPRQFRTGVETLDALLGGGIEEGTSTLLAARRAPASRRWPRRSRPRRWNREAGPRCSCSRSRSATSSTARTA
jgi:arginase